MAFRLRLELERDPRHHEQHAVFHGGGETPLIDSLSACIIYGDLRIRMKDHVGQLLGTAEGPITKWDAVSGIASSGGSGVRGHFPS